MKTFIVTLLLMLGLSGCAAADKFFEDIYDKYPEMGDTLFDQYKDNMEAAIEAELNIRREEIEILGELKGAELNLKRQELQAQIDAMRSALAAQ